MCDTASETESGFPTSQNRNRPFPPALSTSSATEAPSSARRAAIQTVQPASPHEAAMPRPTPPDAPLINMFLSFVILRVRSRESELSPSPHLRLRTRETGPLLPPLGRWIRERWRGASSDRLDALGRSIAPSSQHLP